MAGDKALLERAGKILLSLPGVEQRNSWGFPTFRVGGKMFAATGVRYRGPHLVFKVADPSAVEGDDRFVLVSDMGSWRGYEGWYFYFFDPKKKDDWTKLKDLLTVSWELYLAMLPQKKQDAILPANRPKKKAPVKKKGAKK